MAILTPYETAIIPKIVILYLPILHGLDRKPQKLYERTSGFFHVQKFCGVVQSGSCYGHLKKNIGVCLLRF